MKGILKTLTVLLQVTLWWSCSEPLSVQDNSFRIAARCEFSRDVMRERLFLTEEKAAPGKTYTVGYSLDGDPTLAITGDDGRQCPERFQTDFTDYRTKAWTLPHLGVGEHSISLDISCGDYSQHLEETFTIEEDSFGLHAEVRTDGGGACSVLLLSLTDGISDREYTGSVSVDGDPAGDGPFRVNFRECPILSLDLPLLRPGKHDIEVSVTDGITEEEVRLGFEEPLRHPVMDIYIGHDDRTGRTRMMVLENPYSLAMVVRDSLSVKGRCDYHVCGPMEGQVENLVDYRELTDEASLKEFIPEDGVWYLLVDKDAKVSLMESYTKSNTSWDCRWDSSSEGSWAYFQKSDGVSYYEVTSARQFIRADIEIMQDVTVNIHCTEPECSFNGHDLDGGAYSFKLQDQKR